MALAASERKVVGVSEFPIEELPNEKGQSMPTPQPKNNNRQPQQPNRRRRRVRRYESRNRRWIRTWQ